MAYFTPMQDALPGMAPTAAILCDNSILYPHNFHRYAADGEHLFSSTKDDTALLPILFFPAEESHPVVRVWKKAAPCIVALLDNHSVSFDAIDCVRRRQKHTDLGNDDHTVVITVRTLPEITPLLVKILEKIHRETGGLAVEVRRGRVSPLSFPGVGASFGVFQNHKANGSIGGFLNLVKKSGELVAQCALVSDHVVRPYIATDAGEMSRPAPENMVSYCHGKRQVKKLRPIYCTSPSHARRDAMAANYRKDMVQLAAEIIVYKTSTTMTIPQDELRALEKKKSSIQRMSTRYLNKGFIVGPLFAASGYRLSSHGRRLDWALVKISQGFPSPGVNKVKNCNAQHPHINSRQILHAGKPHSSLPVYKQGSATAMTTGIINPLRSYVASYDANGNRTVTAEWCVIPDENYECFAQRGDSGSLVLERDTANAIGMIFGGHLDGGPAYFTSMPAVTSDIELVTGFNVQFPGANYGS